jgi:hypothetical protein
MGVYVIFDVEGKYIGYSDNKKFAKGLVKQRKKFQQLQMRKLKDSTVDDNLKKALYFSDGDIFDYYGTYLFEHEQDHVHNTCYSHYTKTYEAIQGFMEAVSFIKLNEKEMEIVAPYVKEMLHIGESIQDEYYTSDDPYATCFHIDKLALSILKDMYKEDEK